MKRVTISALISALVFGLLATWLGPKMISYWYTPPVPAGAAASEAGDKTLLVLRLLQPLKAGVYKVSWRGIAADTHKMRGSFSFHVRP